MRRPLVLQIGMEIGIEMSARLAGFVVVVVSCSCFRFRARENTASGTTATIIPVSVVAGFLSPSSAAFGDFRQKLWRLSLRRKSKSK